MIKKSFIVVVGIRKCAPAKPVKTFKKVMEKFVFC